MYGPNAALYVDWRQSLKSDPPYALYFFKNRQYIRWDVDNERLYEGYPREISQGWPGLMEAVPGGVLEGAIHVPEWGNRAFFFFKGEKRVVAWDIGKNRIVEEALELSTVLPSRLIEDGHFTPLFVDYGDARRIYAFRGDEYTRWTVEGANFPAAEDRGYPRKIGDGWTGGLVIAPTCAVSVNWTRRSAALNNRKNYFFLGDLYVRWDVKTHSRNYKLDVPSGWKGWPDFE
ncbi:MAG: hypothetical protein GC150_05565 [Rhizobiales bacterium]|nr:hypothetical protein [Hyphomicrobiales bacterium]